MFTVEPDPGVLNYEDENIIQFAFVPWEINTYDIKLPIYLDDEFDKPYQELQLKGIGALPRILFDRP